MKTTLIALLLLTWVSVTAVGFASDYEKGIDCVVLPVSTVVDEVGYVAVEAPQFVLLYENQSISHPALIALHNKGHGDELQLISEKENDRYIRNRKSATRPKWKSPLCQKTLIRDGPSVNYHRS